MIYNTKDFATKAKEDAKYLVDADTVDVTRVEDSNIAYWDMRIGIDVKKHKNHDPLAVIIHYLEEVYKIVYNNSGAGFEDDITDALYDRCTRNFHLTMPYSFAPADKGPSYYSLTIPFKVTVYLYNYSPTGYYTQPKICRTGIKEEFAMTNIIAKDKASTARFALLDLSIYFVNSNCDNLVKISSNAPNWDIVSYGFINSSFTNVYVDAFVNNIILVNSDVILYSDNIYTSNNSEEYLKQHCNSVERIFYLNIRDNKFTPDYFPSYKGNVISYVRGLIKYGNVSHLLSKLQRPYNELENLAKATYMRTIRSVFTSSTIKPQLHLVDNKSSLVHVNPTWDLYSIFSGCFVRSIRITESEDYGAHIHAEESTSEFDDIGDLAILFSYPIPDYYSRFHFNEETKGQFKIPSLYALIFGDLKVAVQGAFFPDIFDF